VYLNSEDWWTFTLKKEKKKIKYAVVKPKNHIGPKVFGLSKVKIKIKSPESKHVVVKTKNQFTTKSFKFKQN
jgi:hypothetical protein